MSGNSQGVKRPYLGHKIILCILCNRYFLLNKYIVASHPRSSIWPNPKFLYFQVIIL